MINRVLAVHNFYKCSGGEDEVFGRETSLLVEYGHAVTRFQAYNETIRTGVVTAGRAVWNWSFYRELRALAITENPDVAHFHNTFPLISPAGYYAVSRLGIPVVQKVSNFRLLCAGANLVRDGHVCEECIEKKSLLPGLRHRCYRDSFAATAAVTTMLKVHRTIGTWRRIVDVYIAPSEFVKRKLIEGGFQTERIAVKPHFVPHDPGEGSGGNSYALFVGRLSNEKGIQTLAESWGGLVNVPLLIAGDGPLRDIKWPRNVTCLGQVAREKVFELMKAAAFLVVPSICYEIGPLTVLESFACGTPVIASNLGSMAERVEHGRTGLLFRAGDAEDLARQVRWAWEHPQQLRAMRAAAREEYLDKYTAERNYKALMEVYEMAIENARRRRRDRRTALAAVGEAE